MTEPDPDGGWQRLHPLSPLLRGGVVLLAVLGYAATQVVDRVLDAVAPALNPVPDGVGDAVPGVPDEVLDRPLLAVGALLLFLGAVALVTWVSWRFTRFRVGAGHVELRTGVLFRQHRQVPLERVQAVELSRPLLARLLGLAQVVVQSAGGSDSELTLAFLSVPRADAVRDHLLGLAGRSDERVPDDAAPAGGPAGGPAEVPVVAVPNGRLFVATLLHGSTIALALLLAVAALGVGVGTVGGVVVGAVPAVVPVAFGVAVSRVRELLVHGNFTLAASGTALRVRHGLTDLRAATIPVHRVQALEVAQPLWWRRFGWWRVEVNVAGVQSAGEDQARTQTTLLPVGTLEEALAVLARLGARTDDPRLVEALHGTGGEPGWVGASPRARRLDPWSWRRTGYALTPHAVLIRTGRFTRRAVLVPFARVQSLTMAQGPLEARLHLAGVKVVSTPGPVSATLAHLDAEDARRFLVDVAARARAARRVRVPVAGPTTPPTSPLAPGPPPLVD